MANPRVLERLRKSKTDWTQKEFAEKLGLSVSRYKRIISEESDLTVQLIQQVAKLLKMDSEQLTQELMDDVAMVHDPLTYYGDIKDTRKLSISIQLDGTKETLDHWVGILKKVNAILV